METRLDQVPRPKSNKFVDDHAPARPSCGGKMHVEISADIAPTKYRQIKYNSEEDVGGNTGVGRR